MATLFLRLGLTAFGGPAAHIAMMEQEVVARRQWLSKQQFLDLLGAANLIPGPSSSELAIYIGQSQAGWVGLVLAGTCFILPAAVLSAVIAWAYVRFSALPDVGSVLYGVKPVVIAIIAQALWRLGSAAIKSRFLLALALCAAVANASGLSPLVTVLAGGGLALGLRSWRNAVRGSVPVFSWSPLLAYPLASLPGSVPTLPSLFLVFFKVGAVVFGSGYVLLAFLRNDLVDQHHWMTEQQLLDAVAVGQITPGPVFSTATFIGYLLGGPTGAVVATVAIFLPAFLFVTCSAPIVPRLRNSPRAAAFLDGVNVASLALMAVVSWQLGRASIVDLPTAILAGLSGALLFWFKVNSAWLVLGGAALGWLWRHFQGNA